MSTNGVNNAEDADMADCDGEKVVTMMDVLQEQQDFEDDANAVLGASDDKNCTYAKGYIKRQAIYACMTCCSEAKEDPTKRAGVCLACSLNCHENHELIELYTKRNFRCDCGNPKFNSHPCQYTPNKTDLNIDNKYNQNFAGLYCNCHRPYPDPESTEEDEMIQCIICEDWLHAAHLDAVVPGNEQYSEMICKACMDKNDFLHDYSNLTVNIETGDVDITTVNGIDIKVASGDLESENSEKHEQSIELKQSTNIDEAETEKKSVTVNNDIPENQANEDIPSNVPRNTTNEKTEIELQDSSDANNCKDGMKHQEEIPVEDKNDTKLEENPPDNTENTKAEPTEEEPIKEGTEKNITESTKDEKETFLEGLADKDNTKMEEKLSENTEDSKTEITELEATKITSEERNPKEITSEGIEDNKDPKADDSNNDHQDSKTMEDDLSTHEIKLTVANNPTSEKIVNFTPESEHKADEIMENYAENLGTESSDKQEGVIETTNENSDTSKDDILISTGNGGNEIIKDTEMNGSVNNTAIENNDAVNKNKTNEPKIEKPSIGSDQEINSIATDEGFDEVEDATVTATEEKNEISNSFITEHKENKRKLSTEEASDNILVKKLKLGDSKCTRPKGVKRLHQGALFWPSNFRQKLCTCNECISMYKDLSVLFLIDPEDTVSAYEALGKERVDGRATQYEKGLEALSSLDRIQQINALTEYNKMRDKLLDYLKSFKDRKEVVKEEDIKAFFAGMKPKREPDGVYFCR